MSSGDKTSTSSISSSPPTSSEAVIEANDLVAD
jgi:hypothetical protein